MAAVVQDEDRLRPLGESRLHVGRVEVEVVRACDVAEDGRGSGVHDRVRRRDEVQRREDDLVSLPAAGGEQGEVEGGGAVRDGDRVACAGELGERLLELLDARAHAPPARTHDCEHVVDELLADGDVGERHLPTRSRHPRDSPLMATACKRSRAPESRSRVAVTGTATSVAPVYA